MKVKQINNEEPIEFKPIQIELTIESEDELLELWHRLNIGFHSVKDSSSDYRKPFPMGEYYTNSLWTFLDEEYDKYKHREDD